MKGICHSSTGYQVLPYMITYTRALVLWSRAEGDEGREIRQDAPDERWVVMAALGLEAKALWEKRKKRGTSPLWDQIRIPFSRLFISMLISQSYLTLCEPMDACVCFACLHRSSIGENNSKEGYTTHIGSWNPGEGWSYYRQTDICLSMISKSWVNQSQTMLTQVL